MVFWVLLKLEPFKMDGFVSEIKTRGQQVYLNDLDLPVFLSWVWLKRDGKRVQRFVISTKPMKGKTIARWGGNGDLKKQLSSLS